jgi:prepilin-type N-terminal cleavage/methylation domain-containing protein/prepilin-type processing-associated H-X9-DG protein
MPRPEQRGFTLIELLVVISIIALLIAILLPVLGSARAASRTAVCLSNSKQMALATVAYATENDMDLPTVGFSHGGTVHAEQGSWFFLLEPYVDGKLLYQCPSDESEAWNVADANGRTRRVSYATNYMLTGYLSGKYESYNNLDRLPRPTRTIFSGELAEQSASGFATADHVHPETWFGDPATIDNIVREQLEVEQHIGKSNFVYLDGHAETLERTDTFELSPTATASNLIWINNHFWPDVAR